jgi:hypothetical protein
MRGSLILSLTGLVRNSVMRCLDLLPPEFSTPTVPTPPAPMPPRQSQRLISTEVRALVRAEAAALTPRREAIAQAGLAVQARRAASRATASCAATAQPHAPDRTPAPNKICASQPHAPIPGHGEPAIPPGLPGLPNGAARQQTVDYLHKHPAPRTPLIVATSGGPDLDVAGGPLLEVV